MYSDLRSIPTNQNDLQSNSSRSKIAANESTLFLSVAGAACFVSLLTTALSTFTIVKLRLIPGLEPFVFTDNGWTVFNGNVSVNRLDLLSQSSLHLEEGQIQGDISLNAIDSSSLKSSSDSSHSAWMHVQDDEIRIEADQGLRVYSSGSGKKLFPPNFKHFKLPDLKHLSVPNGLKEVTRIRSSLQQPLHVRALESLRIQANGGLKAKAKNVHIKGQALHLASLNGSITLQAEQGQVYFRFGGEPIFDQVGQRTQSNANESRKGKTFSKASGEEEEKEEEIKEENRPLAYKLCACAQTGSLFKIQLKDAQTSCADVRFPVSQNPCPKIVD